MSEPEVVWLNDRRYVKHYHDEFWCLYNPLGSDVVVQSDELTALATWWLKKNPSLLRGILSPEQVEALKWAAGKAAGLRSRKTHYFDEEGEARYAAINKALRSILGEEV